MDRTAPQIRISEIFPEKELTLALAESCTGGLASHLVTSVPGSSAYFKGAVVSYSNDIKQNILGVTEKTIKEHGAVSGPTAIAMAEGARRVLSSDVAASITGIAGPGGGRPGKPVGIAYAAVSIKGKTLVRKVRFRGSRDELKQKFAEALLDLTYEVITRNV